MQIQIIQDSLRHGVLPLDDQFDSLFPSDLRAYSNQHFSGVYVIEQVTRFLADQSSPVIVDVGSGAGKFCLLGALLFPKAHFVGVEYRSELVSISQKLAKEFQLQNIEFFHDNIMNVDFTRFNGIFMFNPFLEHRSPSQRMIGFFDYDQSANTYQNHIYDELSKITQYTKLATYFVDRSQIPLPFQCVGEKMGGTLLFWESIHVTGVAG